VAESNIPGSEDLVSELLARATPAGRHQYLNDHPAALTREFIAALKAHADQQEQQDPQAARRIGEVAAEVADLLADEVAQAIAAVIRANVSRMLGQHQAAVSLYEEAARLYQAAGDDMAAALSQVGKIDALAYLGRYDEAFQVADTVRAVCNAHGEKLARAKLDMNVGVLHARLAQYEAALTHFEAARAAFAALGDNIRVAMLDANRANVLTDLDDFRAATELYRSARKAFDAAGMASAAAQVDQSIAYLLFAQGQFDPALRLFDQAREIFSQTHQPVAVADIDRDQSDVYLRLNLLDEAWDACERAEPVFRQQGHMLEVGHILLNRALIHIGRGHLQESTSLLEKAAHIFHDEGNAVWEAITQMNQAIRLLYVARPAEALTLAEEAGWLFDERGLGTRHCLALTVAGDAYQALGDWRQAETSYRTALAAIEELDAPWLTYRCHHGLGRVHQQQNAQQKAYQAYRQAIEDLERIHGGFSVEPHRIAFLKDKLAPYEDLVLLCLEQQTPDRVADAFQYVERAKSRALVDLLAQNLSGRVQPHDAAGQKLVADLERLRQELNWYYNRINDQNLTTPQRSPSLVAQAWQKIRHLERQANQLLHEMRVRYTDYLSLRQVQSTSLEAIRECLPPNSLLVEFYTARDTTMAFTLDQSHLRVYQNLMGGDQIRHWLDAFRFQINKFQYGHDYVQRHQATLRAGVDRALKALYDGLLAPLGDEFDGRQLVIVPHGLLHYIPFHALYDGQHYLLQQHTIYSAPSAGVLQLCCTKRPEGDGPALLLGIADPFIPHVLEEIQKIGRLMDQAALFTGPQATLDRLRSYGPHSGLIHIASHALYRADNPLFSALRLADGWLNVNDIYELNLKARLVTLSGCETGMGLVANGDELIGLSRAFFYAGAPALVVSLWTVNDESTAALMQRFYETLQSGLSVADSLRRAQLDMLARFHHPYYWASFTATGDGRVSLVDPPPTPSPFYNTRA
jgi:CHAT domain-containing protein